MSVSVTITEDNGAAYAQTVAIGRHRMKADEPISDGGQDAGPSPFQFVSAGLGACTAITIRMYTQRHDWPLVRIKVEVVYEKKPSGDSSAMIDHFCRVISLEGDLTNEQRSRLLQIAEHCPVSEALRRAATIETALADVTA